MGDHEEPVVVIIHVEKFTCMHTLLSRIVSIGMEHITLISSSSGVMIEWYMHETMTTALLNVLEEFYTDNHACGSC